MPLPLLSTVKSPCTRTFPSSPTTTTHFLFSAPPPSSCHHLVPHPPSKVLPATQDSSLHVVHHFTEDVQISPPSVPHVACGLLDLNLLAKTATKLFLLGILLFIFLGRLLTLCMKTYYTAIIVYHLSFLGKSLQRLRYFCFSHLY